MADAVVDEASAALTSAFADAQRAFEAVREEAKQVREMKAEVERQVEEMRAETEDSGRSCKRRGMPSPMPGKCIRATFWRAIKLQRRAPRAMNSALAPFFCRYMPSFSSLCIRIGASRTISVRQGSQTIRSNTAHESPHLGQV